VIFRGGPANAMVWSSARCSRDPSTSGCGSSSQGNPISLSLVDEREARPQHIKAWVRQAKEARERSAAWQERKSGDPLEQMRRMAEGLKDGPAKHTEGPGGVSRKE
jgi:hypothetical protein